MDVTGSLTDRILLTFEMTRHSAAPPGEDLVALGGSLVNIAGHYVKLPSPQNGCEQ
jgi:hypothetical protein